MGAACVCHVSHSGSCNLSLGCASVRPSVRLPALCSESDTGSNSATTHQPEPRCRSPALAKLIAASYREETTTYDPCREALTTLEIIYFITTINHWEEGFYAGIKVLKNLQNIIIQILVVTDCGDNKKQQGCGIWSEMYGYVQKTCFTLQLPTHIKTILIQTEALKQLTLWTW